ncbi:MAG: hypothetical protein ACR2NA_06855 [Solirubrobacterales bacterium]
MITLPIAAAEGAAEILTVLFGVLLAAKIGEELMRRAGQPGVIGMIAAGVVLGPSVSGLVETDDLLTAFAELDVVRSWARRSSTTSSRCYCCRSPRAPPARRAST